MEKMIERGLLYDYYGGLLNEKNRRIYEACVTDDMSLSEISDEMGISRQAVSESLKRIDSKLRNYEDELGLIEKNRKLESILHELEGVLSSEDMDKKKALLLVDRIKEVI